MTFAQWQHLGVVRANNQPFPHPNDKAYLLAPAGAEGPGFLMMQNFRVIMKYNPAEAYALAIGHFADRLRGGQPFVQPWPRQERELTRAERLELQQIAGPARLLQGHAGRPVRRRNTAGAAQLPGLDRGSRRRIRHRRRAGTAPGPLNGAVFAPKITL